MIYLFENHKSNKMRSDLSATTQGQGQDQHTNIILNVITFTLSFKRGSEPPRGIQAYSRVGSKSVGQVQMLTSVQTYKKGGSDPPFIEKRGSDPPSRTEV